MEECRNCRLRSDDDARTIQETLKLPDSKNIVCKFDTNRLKLTGYAVFELFMGSKVRPDGTSYVKEYYGGYRSAFKKIFVWQNVKEIEPFDDLMSKIIAGITRIQKIEEKSGKRNRYDRDGLVYTGGRRDHSGGSPRRPRRTGAP